MTTLNSSGASIRTTTRERGFGIVREALVQDTRLSANARLLAVWLAIRPPGWVVHPEHAQRVLGLGRDAYYSARRQLMGAGYIQSRQRRLPDGTLGQMDFEFDGDGHSSGLDADIPIPLSNNITLTTTTGPDRVVVDESLVWPDCIQPGLRQACTQSLLGLETAQQQMLLDELAGQPAEKVKQPARWLSGVAQRLRADNFAPEAGIAVAQARAARASDAQREALEREARRRVPTEEERARSEAAKAAFRQRAAELRRQITN